MARILRGGKQVIIVVLRHSTLPGHLGVEHVHGEARTDEVFLGQGVTLLFFLISEHLLDLHFETV